MITASLFQSPSGELYWCVYRFTDPSDSTCKLVYAWHWKDNLCKPVQLVRDFRNIHNEELTADWTSERYGEGGELSLQLIRDVIANSNSSVLVSSGYYKRKGEWSHYLTIWEDAFTGLAATYLWGE